MEVRSYYKPAELGPFPLGEKTQSFHAAAADTCTASALLNTLRLVVAWAPGCERSCLAGKRPCLI